MARHVFNNDIEEELPDKLGPMNDVQLLTWLRTARSRWFALIPTKHHGKARDGFALEMEEILS